MELIAQIGKYEIVDLIGRGGMGVVYKARDSVLGRLVALKVMTSTLADSAEVRERFLREARSVSMLQHANIVVVHELGEHDGNPYIVMEYLDGEPLDRTIRNRNPLTVLQKIDVILQVAKALQYAHDKGVVHRDVKPGNIMLMRDGTVKVVDFGIAHLADQTITRTGFVLGTISYMSPEQLNGQPVDARTDIFSLGIVFYLLLTGNLPFEGSSTAETMMKILMEPPPRLEQVGDIDPPELQPIIDKALAKETENRYQICGDFTEHLAQSRKRLELAAQLEKLERERRVILAELNVPKPGELSAPIHGAAASARVVPVPDEKANDLQTQSKSATREGHRNRLLVVAAALFIAAGATAAITYITYKARVVPTQLAAPIVSIAPPDQRGEANPIARAPMDNPSIDSASPQKPAASELPTHSTFPSRLPAQQKTQSKAEQPLARREQNVASSGANVGNKNDAYGSPSANHQTEKESAIAGVPNAPGAPVIQQQVPPMASLPQAQQPIIVPLPSTSVGVAQKIKIPPGTQLTIRLRDPLDSKRNHPGDVWRGTLSADIQVDDQTVVPAGAEVVGRVTDPRKSLSGVKHDSGLVLELTSLSVKGKAYWIQTNQWARLSLKRQEIKLEPETLLNFQLLSSPTVGR